MRAVGPERTAPDATSGESPTEVPPAGDLANAEVDLELLGEFAGPIDLAVRPDDEALYIAEKPGNVVRVDGDSEGTSILDLSNEVSDGSEQGLLGLTFSPDGSVLFVNFTDRDGDTHIRSYPVTSDGEVDAEGFTDLLVIDQPYPNHNGGDLALGPDGALYIALGDGGAGGDPEGRAQDPNSLLGKLLRIIPSADGTNYLLPSDNPFADGQEGAAEVYALGLRNPWRISFDRVTNDLWIADVGQDEFEEIDFLPAGSEPGANFGWDLLEGFEPFDGEREPGLVDPVHAYGRDEGCSVVGGFVYRGEAIPDLQGSYLFGDYCSGTIWALQLDGAEVSLVRELGITMEGLSSFAEDADGELYAMSVPGLVQKIVPG